jgi:hypothetical protein
MKLVAALLISALGASAAHGQAVEWPEKKVRPAEATALVQLRERIRAEIKEENQALGPAQPPDDICIERLEDATTGLFAQELQTFRLSMADMYMTSPVDEETVSGELFDQLQDATKELQTTHLMVQFANAGCSKSAVVTGITVDLESIEGAYRQTISTLQARIGPVRPGFPDP